MTDRLLPYRGIEPPEFINEPWENALFEANTQAEIDAALVMKHTALHSSAQPLEFGDSSGHAFHGNQYTKVGGSDLLPKDENPKRAGVQVTLNHTTSHADAESIRRHGFDPMHGSGGILGRGGYGSLPTTSGDEAQRSLNSPLVKDAWYNQPGALRTEQRNDPEAAETIGLEVTYHNPLLITADDVIAQGDSGWGGYPDRVIADKLGVDRRYTNDGADRLSEATQAAGYDAIIYRDPELKLPENWGDQIVVFNKEQVKVVDPPGLSSSAQGELQLIGLIPFLEQFKKITASIQLEFGDTAGHKFHGNQYTGGIQDGTAEHPFKTSSADEAAELISQGLYVQLPPDSVSILIDKLAQMDDKSKTYDLCKISVPDSNLFCAESQGIPRIDMPQLSTPNPVPGSPASSIPPNKFGEVEIIPAFKDQLKSDGYKFSDVTVPASQLKATQNELNGAKVAGIEKALEKGSLPPGRVFVSNDNYVLDGHHRWAANVALDYKDNKLGDVPMDVTRVDLPISVLVDYAKSFANHMGVPQAAVASARLDIELGDSEGHAFHGNQYVKGEWDRSGDEPRWTQPYDSLVMDAIHSWSGDPASMHIHMRGAVEGAPIPGSGSGKIMRAQAEALREEVKNAPPFDKPLYRGITVSKDRADEYVGTYAVGKTVELSPQGFSESAKVSKGYAELNRDLDSVGIAFTVEPGAHALSVPDKGGTFSDEKERIIGGQFQVTSQNIDGPILRVGLKQVSNITASIQLDFGDVAGHGFHGNQWTGPLSDQVRKEGGMTYSPLDGFEPSTGFIVAKEGIASTFIPAKDFLNSEDKAKIALDRFLVEHADEYDDPNAMIGIWHDTGNSEVVLDVVEKFDSKEEAVKAGVDRNQQAIWDVVGKQEVNTGGTGKP